MIEAQNYAAFKSLITHNHTNLFDLFVKNCAPINEQIKAMLTGMFFEAAKLGYLDMTKRIVAQLENNYLEQLVKKSKQEAFNAAAASNYAELLDTIINSSNDAEMKKLISDNNFHAFRIALKNKQFKPALDMMKYFSQMETVEKNKLNEIVTEECQDLLLEAAKKGEKAVIHAIMALAQDKIDDMLIYNNYDVLNNAHESIKDIFEQREVVMASNFFNFDKIWRKISEESMQYGYKRKRLSEEESKLHLYYLHRLLLRRCEGNESGDFMGIWHRVHLDDVAHLPLLPNNQPNALLRQAVKNDNYIVIKCLLDIDKVRELARKENYYSELLNDGAYTKAQVNFQWFIAGLPAKTAEEHIKVKFLQLIKPIDEKISSNIYDMYYPAAEEWRKIRVNLIKTANVFFNQPFTENSYKTFKAEYEGILESTFIKGLNCTKLITSVFTFIDSLQKEFVVKMKGNIVEVASEKTTDLLKQKPMLQTKTDNPSQSLPEIEKISSKKEKRVGHNPMTANEIDTLQLLQYKEAFLKIIKPLKEKKFTNFSSASEAKFFIIKKLNAAADLFFSKPPTRDSYKVFFGVWMSLEKEKRVLAKHRMVFGAFFAAINNFFKALKEALFNEPRQHSFFNAKTESDKIIDKIDAEISKLGIKSNK